MRNVVELRHELATVFEKLKRGEIKPHEAAEFANIAGKMINSAKVQIEYANVRGERAAIKFLTE